MIQSQRVSQLCVPSVEVRATEVDDHTSDTVCVGSLSGHSSVPDIVEMTPTPTVPSFEEVQTSATFELSLSGLDDVDLEVTIRLRAVVMRSPPAFLKGAHRSATRVALDEMDAAREGDDVRCIRAWKLFLLPRLLLLSLLGGGPISKGRLGQRSEVSARGDLGFIVGRE